MKRLSLSYINRIRYVFGGDLLYKLAHSGARNKLVWSDSMGVWVVVSNELNR